MFRGRRPSREAACRSVRGAPEVWRGAVLAACVLPAEPIGRFGVTVAAVLLVPPEPVSVAALDLGGELSELVVLTLVRRGLLPRLAGGSAPLVLSVRVDGTFLGLRTLAPSDFLAAAGVVLSGLALLATRPRDGRLRDWPPVAVRLSLAGTSVISTSPSSDTGRSGTRQPSSSGPTRPSSASLSRRATGSPPVAKAPALTDGHPPGPRASRGYGHQAGSAGHLG